MKRILKIHIIFWSICLFFIIIGYQSRLNKFDAPIVEQVKNNQNFISEVGEIKKIKRSIFTKWLNPETDTMYSVIYNVLTVNGEKYNIKVYVDNNSVVEIEKIDGS